MNVSVLNSRKFTLQDQLQFAEISGDWNPMHVDPVAARRTIYGDIVVHGVHSLFWALECLAQVAGEKHGLSHLKTDFKRPMPLDDVISCNLLRSGNRHFKLALDANGKVLVRIEGSFEQSPPKLPALPKKIDRTNCRDLSLEEITAASGSLPLFVDDVRFGKMFPGVSRLLPSGQIAELLATTRLVGMECPGLNSIYSGHDLHFHDEHPDGRELHYKVTRADARFSLLWLNVKGPGMSGTITAFVRPPPRVQAPINVVRDPVTPNEFAKVRALVVGGSRGLGEITAKIIASGGGDVWITYNRGREDAERVTREIRSAGFKCSCLQFDVTATETLLAKLGSTWKPNQLYYFATPPISLETGDLFSSEKFHTYCRFFVNGFCSTVEAVLRLGGETLAVFYPSTIFLDKFQEHSTEYCAAKAAGELLCRHLERLFPNVRTYAPRLDRMKTDQTAGLLPVDAEDPLFAMLNAIRMMPIHG
jgi:NADP-dependent 3-hydroxy acid dehydrogenase YdfG